MAAPAPPPAGPAADAWSALVTVHEVGHLCTLDHITDDPAGIMNVEEGAGLDPDDAHFTTRNFEILEKRLGVAE